MQENSRCAIKSIYVIGITIAYKESVHHCLLIGIAYAYMIKLPAAYGLYASIFPSFFYMFFGTSRHASIGGFAIITVMTVQAIRDAEGKYSEELALLHSNSTTFLELSEDNDSLQQLRCAFAIGLTLCVGAAQLLMAVLQMDFLTAYLSDQLVTGFSLGAAVHVIATQMKDLVDLTGLPRRSGTGKIFLKIYDFFANLYRANWYAGVTSLVGGVALMLGKWIVGVLINKYFHRSFPVPFELLLVIFATLFSTVLKLHTEHDVRVVGTIPTGLPSPSLPPFGIISYVWKDSISMAIVIVAVHVSVAKILANKHRYHVDNKQELYALGISNILASFFPVFPVSCGLGRAFICSEIGSKTQLKTIFSCAFLIVVILFVGPYLYNLPMCILATIVVLVLKAVFIKIAEVPHLWRCSKIDCIILVFSCFVTIVFNVVLGLIISVVFTLITIPIRYQFSPFDFEYSIYVEAESYHRVEDNLNVFVFRLNGPVLYMNAHSIRARAIKKFAEWKAETRRTNFSYREQQSLVGATVKVAPGAAIKKEVSNGSTLLVVIDFSAVPFIDICAAESIRKLINDLTADGVEVSLANVSDELNERLYRFGIIQDVDSRLGESVAQVVKHLNSKRKILDVHFENVIGLIVNDENSWFL
ncbi:Sulfate permease family protein 3 [Toxocara canis]|uniref:Sulfate permease family protein 3 n=1 Tax=Toxocara canis TaxID=6265 RepID=A0A0B2V5H7_TOXCA|nr:Sulfate permease family protein 3 [Toxocara canis]